MALGYLLDPFIQIQNDNGTPIVGAKIYVYNADTTNLATTYNDFEGHLNTNPVITDDLGNATIIADDGIEYDVSVHDENDLLLFTKKNISIDKTSSAGGNIQVAPGYGVTVERVGNVFTVSVDTDLIATKEDLNDKQDKLTGGDNIEITNDNTVNVVNRKELVTQYPLRINRTNDRVKIYLDSDFSDEFKTKQTPVEYGGAIGNYISYIAQNENGEIEATVQETVLPSFDDIHAGDNISITRTGNDLTISSKDWTNDITSAVSGKLDTSTFTAYSAAHASDDVTPYSGGTGISVNNHTISCTGDITAYTAGSNINITNHVVSGKDWSSTINGAVSGKIDKVTGGAGSETNPVYYNETSGVLPCFTNSQTFMGLNNNYIDNMSGYNNVMYGNSNTYNFSHSDSYAPNSPHYNAIFGYNNNVTVSGSNSYLYNASEIGTNNNLILNGGSECIIVGSNNAVSGTNGGFANQCGIVGDSNKMIVDPKPGDEYNSTYLNYIFGYKNTISSIGWGCTIFGNENETKARSLSYLFGYRNKINDNQSFDSILFGENNQINATTAETKRLTETCLVGFDNKINASNRASDMANLYAFGKGNTIASGYSNFLYGYGNSTNNTSNAMCFGKGLAAETDKIKYGSTNCYLEIDENAGKIYKVINGTRTEI